MSLKRLTGMGGWRGDAQRCVSQQVAPSRELPALSSFTCPGVILLLSGETGISREGLSSSPEAGTSMSLK